MNPICESYRVEGIMVDENLPRERIFLLGFMGAGKSTVAPLLADRLGSCWVDTDRIVEEMADRTIPDIFETRGENHFRVLEKKALRCALDRGSKVIAVGGGAPMDDENWELMQREGLTCYLQLSAREVLARIEDPESRPLLAGLEEGEMLEKIIALLHDREARYRQARVIVSSDDRSPEQVAERIFSKVEGKLT